MAGKVPAISILEVEKRIWVEKRKSRVLGGG
jgi:hypothetical protein